MAALALASAHFLTIPVLALTGILLAGEAQAARNVDIRVTTSDSTGGVNTALVQNGVTATYQYTVYNGQSVNDTIPVEICMTGYSTDSPYWSSLKVTFGNQASILPGVTPPADQTFTYGSQTPDCRSVSIQIATGPLTLSDSAVGQNFNANFSLSDVFPSPSTGGNRPQGTFTNVHNVHIKVAVLPAVGSVSCFLTDSEGNFLNNCSGTPVSESGSDDGRFAIVANKRNIEVATNPGQFYYNLVWYNATGSSQTVDVNMARTGLAQKGRQALHAAIFNGYLDPMTPADFAVANEYGVPDGSDDKVLGVTVPAGSSLLVTYHLEWMGLGAAVPSGCAGICGGANQRAAVTGTVSGNGITTETCKADAFGYKKP